MDNRIEKFMKNEYWARYYNEAPTEACKRFIELEFMNSDRTITANENDEWDAVERRLSKSDWEHLFKYAGNNPFKTYCQKIIESFE